MKKQKTITNDSVVATRSSSIYNANEISSESNSKTFSVDDIIFEHTIEDCIQENNLEKVEKWLHTTNNDDSIKQKTVLFTDLPPDASGDHLDQNNLAKSNCLTDSTNKIHNTGKKTISSINVQKISSNLDRENQNKTPVANTNKNNNNNISNNSSAKLDGKFKNGSILKNLYFLILILI